MSIRSNSPTGYINNQRDSLNRVIHELRNIIRVLSSRSSGPTPVYETGAGVVTPDTLRVTLETGQETILSDIETILANLDKDAGVSTVNTLRVILEDVSRNNLIDLVARMVTNNTYTSYENWDKIPGNSKEFTWVNGSLPGNRIVSTIVYKTGLSTVVTQTLAYNSNDEVTSITAV